jgi:hypothetical protein
MTRGIVVWIFWGCQKIDSVVTWFKFLPSARTYNHVNTIVVLGDILGNEEVDSDHYVPFSDLASGRRT